MLIPVATRAAVTSRPRGSVSSCRPKDPPASLLVAGDQPLQHELPKPRGSRAASRAIQEPVIHILGHTDAHRVSGSSSHYVRVNSPQKPPTAPTTISRWPWGLRSLLHPFFWGGPPGGDKRRKKACISLTHAQCNMVHCRLNHEGYSASMLTSC